MSSLFRVAPMLALAVAACERQEAAVTEARADKHVFAAPGAGERARDVTDAPYADTLETAWVDPGADDPEPVTAAIAVLHPARGRDIRGVVRFEQVSPGTGVRVVADVRGLPPGPHAVHVHVYGDCSAPGFQSAGPHFNFQGSSLRPGDVERITGNLGELTPGDDGRARASAVIEHATLQGAYSIVGRSVVVHAQGNDPAQPPEGGAGDRLACGVIGVDPRANR